jgi:hypothetical protein
VGGDAPLRRTDISFLPATKKGRGATPTTITTTTTH